MKKILEFLKFGIKLAVILLASYGLFHLTFWFLWEWKEGPNAYDDSYARAFLRQIEAISDTERDPEVIVFGSSYVPFSIDVDTVSSYTGMNTQTLGTEAAIGDIYLMEQIMEYSIPGDVVVFILGKASNGTEDFMTVSFAYEGNRDILLDYWAHRDYQVNYFRSKLIWRKIYSMTAAKVVEHVRSLMSDKEQVYSLDSFDEKGNMIKERIGNLMGDEMPVFDRISFDDLDTEKLDKLNELYDWCNENGVTLLVSYMPFCEGSFSSTPEEIAQYDSDVDNYINAPLLMKQEDYFFPYDNFYNHMYHLNSDGARKYSKILGEAIYNYINSGE